MLKEKNKQKFICHPEVLTEGSIDSSHSFRMTESGRSTSSLSFPCLTRESTWCGPNAPRCAQYAQSGRSMVEMLGVLAVIGVLSVAGIAGYSVAMQSYRANELLNEASKRAAIVAVQAMQGRENLSIGEFGTENARLNFDEMVPHDTTNTQFTLTITGVDEAVCQQIQKSIGPTIRKFEPATCSGDNNTVKLTFNDDMSATAKASDYDGDETGCKADSSRQYCASNDTCISATDTCPSTGPSCPSGSGEDNSTWTGGAFTVTEGSDSITCYCGAGKVYDGSDCITCATSGNCSSNATVCPGYYCSIAAGTIGGSGVGCGTDTYTPGVGSVATLGTPETKGSYKASPDPVASWDAAVNYCAALKRDGLVTHGRLANVPSDCSVGSSCSALPNDVSYWLNGFVQWDCNWRNYSTTHGSNSCYVFHVSRGRVDSYRRDNGRGYALCE